MDIFSSHETQNIPEDSIVSVFGLVGKRHSTVCLGFRFKKMVRIEISVKMIKTKTTKVEDQTAAGGAAAASAAWWWEAGGGGDGGGGSR